MYETIQEQQAFLSKDNTRWTKGIAALSIMLMHFVMQVEGYPRFLNVLGSVGVAAFLFLSAFGLEESYKVNGLRGYWRKRLLRVVVPCWIMYLFALPFRDTFDGNQLVRNLLFFDSDLWYIDFLLRWSVVYWIGRRFFPCHTTVLLLILSVYYIFGKPLQSAQALSFFAGYMVSKNYKSVNAISRKRMSWITVACIVYGLLFMLIKMIPTLRVYIGTLPFNLLLLNIMLPLAVSIITLPSLMPWVKRIRFINECGRMSYEIYIVHVNFMLSITNYFSIVPFTVFSLMISSVFNRINTLLKQPKQFLVAFSIVLLTGVNYVFLVKYSMRATPYFGYICIPYAMLLMMVLMHIVGENQTKAISNNVVRSVKKFCDRHSQWLFVVSLSILVVLMLIVQYHFDPMQNRVDRWSAIANPLSALFHGEFPYLAKTHLGGNASPFPVWMIVHIPFYLLGNVGLSEVFSAAIFLISVRCVNGSRAALKATVVLGCCISLWYETAVRSDLISNFLLLAAFINMLTSRQIRFSDHPFALSLCAGLWLSTRLSVAFPLFVSFFVPWLRKLSLSTKISSVLIVVVTFCVTFLPLIIWDFDSLFFAKNNPFYLQSRQGNTIDAILLTVLSILFALKSYGDKKRMMFSSAALLLLSVLITFGHNMAISDTWTDIFNSKYDISYLNASIPFLIMTILPFMRSPSEYREKCP